MELLKDKVVLLTGGSRGIGTVIAEALVKRGARLVLTARSAAGLQDVAQRIRQPGAEIVTIAADLGEPSERERLVHDVLQTFGRIDVLVNNAGLETEGAYVDLPWPSIRETVEVNFVAPMELTYLVLPDMLERKEGHLVNIASIAAKSGAPYAATYSGTKAALAEWSRGLRLELEGSGVKVSTIFPGYVRDVGMFAKFGLKPPWLVGSCAPSEVADAVVAAIGKGRIEQIVNSRPLRYSFMMNELSPPIGDWLLRISGLVDFQRRKVGK